MMYLPKPGRVSSSAALASVIAFNIETTDVLDFVTNTTIIEYSLRVGTANVDGFDFGPAAGASNCIELDASAGTPVYLGAARTLLTVPFDLANLGVCGILESVGFRKWKNPADSYTWLDALPVIGKNPVINR